MHDVDLDAGDAKRNSAVVNLVVAECFQQSVADLRQAQSLFAVDHQTHDGHASETNASHLSLDEPRVSLKNGASNLIRHVLSQP